MIYLHLWWSCCYGNVMAMLLWKCCYGNVMVSMLWQCYDFWESVCKASTIQQHLLVFCHGCVGLRMLLVRRSRFAAGFPAIIEQGRVLVPCHQPPQGRRLSLSVLIIFFWFLLENLLDRARRSKWSLWGRILQCSFHVFFFNKFLRPQNFPWTWKQTLCKKRP